MNSLRFAVMAAALAAFGLGLAAYKALVLGLPLSPDAKAQVWVVEARTSFRAGGKVKASLRLPNQPPNFDVLSEDFISRDFGLAVEQDGTDRMALWSVRQASGAQTVYYRLTVRPNAHQRGLQEAFPGYPEVPEYPELEGAAIEVLLDDVRSHSADIATFASQLIRRLNNASPESPVGFLTREALTDTERAERIVAFLAGARIPARVILGLRLADGMSEGQLEPWIEVHNEQRWLAFDPRTGDQGYPPLFLVWQRDAGSTLTLSGASRTELRFSSRLGTRDALSVARNKGGPAVNWSILGLPLHVQNVYSVLLTVPLGAFLVVLLRNLVGIRTFGTFMPVLIALAFRETQLAWGVVLFSVIVALGLAMRFTLEHLKLLLVPRLTAVLIIVIMLMLGLSILSQELGLEHGLSIALFPMVIIAMTIERMSIVWEEHGASEAILRGSGSLAVAALAYTAMSQALLIHLVSIFPELLLVLLSLTLMIGRYTGYRLSELWRFRAYWWPGARS